MAETIQNTEVEAPAEVETESFICPMCGGMLRYDIAKDKFLCASCGHESEIQAEKEEIKEYDFSDYAEREKNSVPFEGTAVADCKSCGAEIAFDKLQTATVCPMCGSTQIFEAKQRAGIPPEGIIPFKIDKPNAEQKFKQWIKHLWFAPNQLKKSFQEGKLGGKYVPFWTYDAEVSAHYIGEGGIHRTVSDGDGKSHIENTWYTTTGNVQSSFDDIQICASGSEGGEMISQVLPYNTTTELLPYAPEYLSGFQAEVYALKADVGFETAKDKIKSTMSQLAESQILRRYDCARVSRIDPVYKSVSYKHVLLPLWSAVFGYRGKSYRYIINGETGAVYGKRPYSAVKITLAILAAVALIGGMVFLFTRNDEPQLNAQEPAAITEQLDQGIIEPTVLTSLQIDY
ncbi:MAG: hypothetical protein RR731_00730 [Oscillospiraceae bacterium]